MTQTKQEAHKHDFKSPKLIRLPVQDRPEKYSFKGDTMGIILKTCKCGEDVAVDYGKYQDLISKYKEKK